MALELTMAKYLIFPDPVGADRAKNSKYVKGLLNDDHALSTTEIPQTIDLEETHSLILIGTRDSLKEVLNNQSFEVEGSEGLALLILFSIATRTFGSDLMVIQVVAYKPDSQFNNALLLRADWVPFPPTVAPHPTSISRETLSELLASRLDR
jgi:hypothetical protein